MPNPYSYVTRGGVTNKRTRVSDADATLEDLRDAFKDPLTVDVEVDAYHAMSKRERGNIKKRLPYFVGGVCTTRDDAHVTQRTYLTLDIEQGKHDETPPHPSAVAQRLDELGGAGWIYSSLSHTDDAPRYRVVLPIGRHDAAAYDVGDRGRHAQAAEDAGLSPESRTRSLQASTLAAAERLGVAPWCQPESWTLSQAMYLPAVLDGGTFYESLHHGKSWRLLANTKQSTAAESAGTTGKDWDTAADSARVGTAGAEGKSDLVLQSLKVAGLYLRENPKHKGMHYIVCPFLDEHEAENDTQTVYYEANYDGNPRAAVKCFDTAPDQDGKPHLTMLTLVRYLRDNDYMSQAEQDAAGVLDDDETFIAKSDIQRFVETTPEQRDWVVNDFLPVGKVTVLAGPGGVSKSMLALNVAMYGALGLTYGPFVAPSKLKTLFISYEDDTLELHRRVHNAVEHLIRFNDGVFDVLHDVRGTLRNNLLAYPAEENPDTWLILTKPERYGAPERTERVEWLVGFIKRQRIRLLVLDPAVYTHQLEENNISDMATYMQTLTYVARQAECAVLVLHHMSKAAGWLQLDDINQSALRGASSFADNARSVGVVVSMPTKDAPAYGIEVDHVSKYAVFKHVKHNYSATLGTHIFQRDGATLVPRPDIVRLNEGELTEAKERQINKNREFMANSSAEAILKALSECDEFISLSTIVTMAHVHKRRLKELMQVYEERNWVELEDGPRGATMVRITKEGGLWLEAKMNEVPE